MSLVSHRKNTLKNEKPTSTSMVARGKWTNDRQRLNFRDW